MSIIDEAWFLLIEEPWHDLARCKGSGKPGSQPFFPVPWDKQQYRTSKRDCHLCPVAMECLEHALLKTEDFGIWGATTPKERQKLRLDMKLNNKQGEAEFLVPGKQKFNQAGLDHIAEYLAFKAAENEEEFNE